MTINWPRWNPETAPGALAHYVKPATIGALVRLPGPSNQALMARLREIYTALAARHIRYSFEHDASEPGRQVVRPPEQIIGTPGHGTCLDLAVTMAGACQLAGLRSMVIIVESDHAAAGRHALVGVFVAPTTTPYPLTGDVHREQPPAMTDEIMLTADGRPRNFVVIDPIGVTRPVRSQPTKGVGASFDEAVSNGAAYLGAGWRWVVGIDVSTTHRAQDELPSQPAPKSLPLRSPYLDPSEAATPLRLLRSDYEVVPFVARDELTILEDLAEQALTNAGRPIIALVAGVGGAGKTRLAAELVNRLLEHGWYSGLLRKEAAAEEIAWLGNIESPIAVVVDYAEGRDDHLKALAKALHGRETAALIVLTSREIGAWWETVSESLESDGIGVRLGEQLVLDDQHEQGPRVFVEACKALETYGGRQPRWLVSGEAEEGWTTLEYVLAAWLAAQPDSTKPTSRQDLYEQIIRHERSYWYAVHGVDAEKNPGKRAYELAALILTMTNAGPARRTALLALLPELVDGQLNRVRETLVTCLGDSERGDLGIRPDPIADHLIVTRLGSETTLLTAVLQHLNDDEYITFMLAVQRAAGADGASANAIAVAALIARPDFWQITLQIALAQRGPALHALESVLDSDDTPLPVEELWKSVPDGHVNGRELMRLTAEAMLKVERRKTDGSEEALAARLDLASRENAGSGRYERALLLAREAVDIRRVLAEQRPDVFLPNLAGSLNNLSNQQSDNGDRSGALASIREAVDIYRVLAEQRPDVFLPDLALSLNNLSNQQSDNGVDSASGAIAFEKVIDSMADSLTRAQLRAAHARWCGANGEAAHASRSLGFGAAEAADGEPTALGRARRELRSAFAALDLEVPGLPLWMTAQPTETAVAAINALAAAGDASTLAELIAEHCETIDGDAFAADLEVFEALFPQSDDLARVRRLVQACSEHGLDAVLTDLRRQSELDAIIAAWVATESWPASKQFLAEHPRLTQPDIAEALAAMQTADAAVHAGVLHLTARLGIDTAYDIVTDPAAGLPWIDTAIRTADEPTLIAILQASQHLNRVPFAAGLAAATILTMRGQPDDAVAELESVVATSAPNQRKAASITLQALAKTRQELSTTVARLRALLS